MIELRLVECCVTCDREMYGESFCVYCSFDELGAKYGQALTELVRLRMENDRLMAILATIDAIAPKADRTCVKPGVTLSEAARNQLREQGHPLFVEES